jgi:PAP2 superfamily
MKRTHVAFSLSFLLLFASCKKWDFLNPKEDNDPHGHITQAKEYSSEAVFKWIDLQLRLIRTTAIAPGPNNARLYGYTGVALYESVVGGMPKYKSLGEQLSAMPAMPSREPGKAYHWPTCANAALASILKNLYSITSDANKASIDSLENALNTAYQQEVHSSVFERSAAYGKAVAVAVYDWAKTDGISNPNPAYTPPGLLPNAAPGLWVPTPPNNPAAAGPYYGSLRTMVPGSLSNSAPPAFPAYSIDPSSDYHKEQKEVYDISQSLTPAQIELALYYRDAPGYPGGAHYLPLLEQVLQKENSKLDASAAAFALTGIAVSDALVGCWKVKYEMNIERPITYIRNVMGYTGWNAKFNTPGHPDYPSGHSTGAGAFEITMTELFGKDYQFTNHTYDYLGMPPQSYTSFSDLAVKIGLSRIYGGIHTRYACEKGREQGQKIAKNILSKIKFQ